MHFQTIVLALLAAVPALTVRSPYGRLNARSLHHDDSLDSLYARDLDDIYARDYDDVYTRDVNEIYARDIDDHFDLDRRSNSLYARASSFRDEHLGRRSLDKCPKCGKYTYKKSTGNCSNADCTGVTVVTVEPPANGRGVVRAGN